MIIDWSELMLPSVFLVVGLIIYYYDKRYRQQRAVERQQVDNAVDEIKDFRITKKYISQKDFSGIAFDDKRNKICLITNTFRPGQRVIDYKDFVECEICVDSISISKISRSNQVGRAILGGVLLGGAGAVIGGLSAKKESSEKIKSIDLHITVHDTKYPLHIVNFLCVETTKGSALYNEAMKEIQQWHSLLSILIKKADDEASSANARSSASISDELSKLADLLNKGILTQEEFDEQKKKLLSQ